MCERVCSAHGYVDLSHTIVAGINATRHAGGVWSTVSKYKQDNSGKGFGGSRSMNLNRNGLNSLGTTGREDVISHTLPQIAESPSTPSM
jgi:hypothetical protein